MLYQLLESKKPQEKQVGQLLTGLEYENLVTALSLALEAHASILEPYRALSGYLDATQDQKRGLELGQMVLRQLEGYSSEKLAGELGAEFAGVIDEIANRQLRMRLYEEAETSYQKALAIFLELKILERATAQKLSAGIYHNLGSVAQEQRQWQQAEQYFQSALEILREYDDTYAISIVLRSMVRLWKDGHGDKVPKSVASILGMSEEEAIGTLQQVLE